MDKTKLVNKLLDMFFKGYGVVPLAVAATLGLLAVTGVTGDMTVEEALTLLFTGLVAWLSKSPLKRKK